MKADRHLHDPVDEVLVFVRNVCGAFGRGRGDEGRRPDTIGVLIPPLFRLLPQLGFLFLVQVRDSSGGETNNHIHLLCIYQRRGTRNERWMLDIFRYVEVQDKQDGPLCRGF